MDNDQIRFHDLCLQEGFWMFSMLQEKFPVSAN
jgi:hypothetical protein